MDQAKSLDWIIQEIRLILIKLNKNHRIEINQHGGKKESSNEAKINLIFIMNYLYKMSTPFYKGFFLIYSHTVLQYESVMGLCPANRLIRLDLNNFSPLA